MMQPLGIKIQQTGPWINCSVIGRLTQPERERDRRPRGDCKRVVVLRKKTAARGEVSARATRKQEGDRCCSGVRARSFERVVGWGDIFFWQVVCDLRRGSCRMCRHQKSEDEEPPRCPPHRKPPAEASDY